MDTPMHTLRLSRTVPPISFDPYKDKCSLVISTRNDGRFLARFPWRAGQGGARLRELCEAVVQRSQADDLIGGIAHVAADVCCCCRHLLRLPVLPAESALSGLMFPAIRSLPSYTDSHYGAGCIKSTESAIMFSQYYRAVHTTLPLEHPAKESVRLHYTVSS